MSILKKENGKLIKCIFLDDDIRRIEIFLSKFKDLDVTVVMTAEECIQKLKENHYDIASYDHDLGGLHFVSTSREDSGSGVARWLYANPDKISECVAVHSFNFAGAKYMCQLVSGAIYSPFGDKKYFDLIQSFIDSYNPKPLKTKLEIIFDKDKI